MPRELFFHSPHKTSTLPTEFLRALRKSHPSLFTPRIQLDFSEGSLTITGTTSTFFQKQQIQETLRKKVPTLRINNRLLISPERHPYSTDALVRG
ncbi:hypothetical protein Plim_0514 [Planctopirus limnophila DSM 3776]|uniref:BON domain-containing protein n=1 Tax=Planctopirus limnophila (strain ATCC 43296 / DSM 3776 / IFAM 1008 / Mu 290) TaxID=521674 RepID=D5SQB0_PLAL2|nr:hypothetical protein Plim_0514 [Planctopirus limnophila DSM 3776]